MSPTANNSCDALPEQTVRSLRGIHHAELTSWARRTGQRLMEVEFDPDADKAEVLRAIARAFALPSWFGLNLDALYDALTDLPDRESTSGYAIVLRGLPRSDRFTREQRDALLDVFRDVAKDFAKRGVALRVLYS